MAPKLEVGSKVFYQGREAEVKSSYTRGNNTYVTIQMSDGKEISVPQERLASTSIFSFEPDPEVIEQYDAKIAEEHSNKLAALAEKKSLMNLLDNYLSSWGVRFPWNMNTEQQEQYNKTRNDIYAAQMNYTAASNREGSTLLDKYIYLT